MPKTREKQRSNLAENIIKRRKEKGWTQADLASEANIGLNTLKQIERDVSGGWPGTKDAIAKALGCTVDELHADPLGPTAAMVGMNPESFRTFMENLSELSADLAHEVSPKDEWEILMRRAFRKASRLRQALALWAITQDNRFAEEYAKLARANLQALEEARTLTKASPLKPAQAKR